jgi:hypothetical protein
MPIPPSSAKAHRETIDAVGLLRWTYQRQRADVISGRDLREPFASASVPARLRKHWSGCGCAQLEAVAVLGVRIEPGGKQRDTLHPDAEHIHDQVIAISERNWPGAVLLRRYGKQGGVPDWESGPQEYEPLRDGRDKIIQDRYDEVIRIRDGAGRDRMVPAHYCPLVKYPSDEWIEMMRGEYTVWYAALEDLANRLEGVKLARWTLAGLGAVAYPWRSDKGNKS